MKEEVYIVLLNYNGASDTMACIHSLLQLQTASSFKIVVVDNSETMNNFELLQQFAFENNLRSISFIEENQSTYQNEELILIKSKKNQGFAAGNNIGIRFSLQQKNCAYLWILNNDTVVTPNSLEALLSYHKAHPTAILGSKLLYFNQPDTIQAVGGIFNERYFISEHVGEGLPKDTQKKSLPKIDYPIGAAIFVSRLYIEKVGLLNETYFLYYEELDWVKSAKKFGFIADWCEESVVYHKEGASIGSSYKNEKSYFSEIELFKSRKKFVANHYRLNMRFYFSSILLILNRLRKGKFKLANALLKITINDLK